MTLNFGKVKLKILILANNKDIFSTLIINILNNFRKIGKIKQINDKG